MTTYKGDNSKECCSCTNNAVKGMMFCSDCEDDSFAFYDVDLSKKWAERVASLSYGQFKEIVDFSKRHGYREDLVIVKMRSKFGITIELSSNDIMSLTSSKENHELR